MKTILPLLFITLVTGALHGQDKSWLGEYRIEIFQKRSYATDRIVLKKFDGRKVEGEIGLDLSIGPEARKPMDWEKFYTLPFTGKFNKEYNGFEAEVKIPGRTGYEFKLYFDFMNGKEILTGHVKINPIGTKGDDHTVGVVGYRKSEQ